MDRYQRVEKPREDSSAIGANEIRITAQGRPRNYITYALAVLQVRPSLLSLPSQCSGYLGGGKKIFLAPSPEVFG
jgi:hypothetical protein